MKKIQLKIIMFQSQLEQEEQIEETEAEATGEEEGPFICQVVWPI